MKSRRHNYASCVLLLSAAIGSVAFASDEEGLTSMLNDFLAGASLGSSDAHDRFWAEDLIYTSSNGTRTNKAEIMDGVRSALQAENDGPNVIYSAEEIDIRLYGDTAIVAFRLVGTPHGDEGRVMKYFNTGTFLKRDGTWKVVAWQATKIADPLDVN